MTWEARIEPAATPFTVFASSGSIAPGGSVDVDILATPPAAELGKTWDAVLKIKTSDTEHPSFDVPLHLVTQGAVLSSPTFALDFGEMPLGAETPPLAAVFENSGNAPVTIGLPAVAPFRLAFQSGEATVTLDPGAKVSVAGTFKATSLGEAVAKWRPTIASGAVCGDIPEGPALRGKGVGGVIGVTPGTLDFKPACGAGGDRASLYVVNTSKQPVAFDAAAKLATHVSVEQASGVIPPESKLDVGVKVGQIPQDASLVPNAYGDDVVVHTLAPMDAPHTVPVTVSARGAHLQPVAPVAFGKWVVPTVVSQSFSVTNDGNEAATLALSVKRPFDVPTTLTVLPGQTVPVSMGLIPTPVGLGVPLNENVVIEVSSKNACQLALPSVAASVTVAERDTTAALGGYDYCAVGYGGVPYCWGLNSEGQVGDGTTVQRDFPVPVKGLANVTHLALGWHSACARRSDGTVWCWGANDQGQLGNGSIIGASTPQKVLFSWNQDDALDVVGTYEHFCARRAAGLVSCWGSNSNYQIQPGNFTPTMFLKPTTVTGLPVTHLVASNHHTCWLRGGALSCLPYTSPNPPPDGLQWTDLQGGGHVCGQSPSSNEPICFAGWNTYKQLGPTGPLTWDQLAVTGDDSLVLVQGTVLRWGEGNPFLGQDSATPVPVPNATSIARIYGSGSLGFLARKQDGTLHIFGFYKVQQPQPVIGFD